MLDKEYLHDPDDRPKPGNKADENSKKYTNLNLINMNAICPKIDSLLEVMVEMEAHLTVVTETWMRDGVKLQEQATDLSLGAGMGFISRNRQPSAANGVCYGGVALLWRESLGQFREIELRNPEDHEVLAAAGSVRGLSRKVAILAYYLPPNLVKRQADRCMKFISDTILGMKTNSGILS